MDIEDFKKALGEEALELTDEQIFDVYQKMNEVADMHFTN